MQPPGSRTYLPLAVDAALRELWGVQVQRLRSLAVGEPRDQLDLHQGKCFRARKAAFSSKKACLSLRSHLHRRQGAGSVHHFVPASVQAPWRKVLICLDQCVVCMHNNGDRGNEGHGFNPRQRKHGHPAHAKKRMVSTGSLRIARSDSWWGTHNFPGLPQSRNPGAAR